MAITKVTLFFYATLYVQLAQTHLALPEGAKCMVDEYPGKCRLWKECQTFMVDHQTNLFPPVCSFKGMDPIVCCTGCDTEEDISKAELDPMGGILWKTNQKSWNQCIDYYMTAPYACKRNFTNTADISKQWNADDECFEIDITYPKESDQVAGSSTDAGGYEFSHMALLGYGRSRDSVDWLCGGTIISDRFILTAAHCNTGHFGRVTYAALGAIKQSDLEELWQVHKISRIIPYPLFRHPSKYNDIALLETTRQINFNELVVPACLPHLGLNASDDEAETTSWTLGYTEKSTNTLQVIHLKKFDKTRCSELYRVVKNLDWGYDDSTQMCYGVKIPVKDTCGGNSGGPVYMSGQASSCQKTVMGVTSYGLTCGSATSTGLYTRVSPYVPWIESIVWA